VSHDTDAALERRIKAVCDLYGELLIKGKRAEADAAWSDMKRLISMRSPAQVARMEREKGLA
jgi:hypothetical protein